MNAIFKFLILILSCFNFLQAEYVKDKYGNLYFRFADGTVERVESIYKNANKKVQPTKERVFDQQTGKSELIDCKEKFSSITNDSTELNGPEQRNVISAPLLSHSEFSFEEFLHEQKYLLVSAGVALSIYSYLMLKLYNAKNYVNKTTTWSSFNKNIPIESLYEIPQEKFLADLEVVIYRTFSEDEDNPNYQDTEPLYLFVKAAQKEIKRLEKFVNLYWYCKLPFIALLFPDYDDELILAQEKIERLSYMQELVTKKLYEIHS